MWKMLFVAMLSLLVLLMVMPFAAAETQKATGTANGFGGELTVEVTVDGKQIVSVEVLENKETPGVADPAINNLPGEIVAAQSVAVDVKSGCTLASNAVLEATKTALLSLGFTEEEITAKVEAKAPAAEEIVRTADDDGGLRAVRHQGYAGAGTAMRADGAVAGRCAQGHRGLRG